MADKFCNVHGPWEPDEDPRAGQDFDWPKNAKCTCEIVVARQDLMDIIDRMQRGLEIPFVGYGQDSFIDVKANLQCRQKELSEIASNAELA